MAQQDELFEVESVVSYPPTIPLPEMWIVIGKWRRDLSWCIPSTFRKLMPFFSKDDAYDVVNTMRDNGRVDVRIVHIAGDAE